MLAESQVLTETNRPTCTGDQVRHRPPPKGISHEVWWTSIKLARMGTSVHLPLVDKHSRPFVYSTPSPKNLPARMQRLIKFLNPGQKPGQFLHPIIKAIIGHFFIAYEHPFADGNGRAARDMCYWLANSAGYWVLEFASISSILRASPAKYARSFLRPVSQDAWPGPTIF